MVNLEQLGEDEFVGLSDRDLKQLYEEYIHEGPENGSTISETSKELVNFVLNNISISHDNRLILPALWNEKVKHLLPNNYHLSSNILHSIIKKYKPDTDKLLQYDAVIRQQVNDGILEPVSDLHKLKKDKNVSFLPHSAVFKPHADSTKCRLVLLSNLCEKGDGTNLSHNQISLPGPQLNNKLLTSLILYRFNKYLIICDIVQAFLQLCLRAQDSEKLHLLWFDDVCSGKFEERAFKYKRVPMGLRFSPFLLMISLYYMLVHANPELQDDSICNMAYNLSYMDNIAISSSSREEAIAGINKITKIFEQYSLKLQKFHANFDELNHFLSANADRYVISSDERGTESCNLFGILWDKSRDSFKSKTAFLCPDASTRREFLRNINANFDPMGMYLPTLNRAKLFLHEIVSEGNVAWDVVVDKNKLKDWRNISNQYNNNCTKFDLEIPRFIGNYNDHYELIACVDASKLIYGAVVYIKCIKSGKVNFLLSKNRIVSKSLEHESIPVLELIGIHFGVMCLNELRKDLSQAYCPIQINEMHLYTDSTVALNWVHSKVVRFTKIEQKRIIINNKLDDIVKVCNSFPITFHHLEGKLNPADCVTRPMSAALLAKSNFLCGLKFDDLSVGIRFSVPSMVSEITSNLCLSINFCHSPNFEPLFEFDRYSSFRKSCKIFHWVRLFITKLKIKVNKLNPTLFSNVVPASYSQSVSMIIKQDQRSCFPDVLDYFEKPGGECPQVVLQLNLFVDRNWVVRVKGKMEHTEAKYEEKYPILLHKTSKLVPSLLNDLHLNLKHAGIYRILNVLRKQFYIPNAYNVVKKFIGSCIVCKRLRGRTIKLNQGQYKPFRVNPSKQPFRDIALDHIGPFTIVDNFSNTTKIYLLIITCLYTRAINLIVCSNINNKSFLQALQLHVHQYGFFQTVLSDNGSPIVSSLDTLVDTLNDPEVSNFLKENNIKKLDFTPYPPGASFLGGVVESLVKQVKHLIYGSIGRRILKLDEFYFLTSEAKMLVNKRPIAYEKCLIDPEENAPLGVITPEMLLTGYDVPSLSIIPLMHSTSEDSDYQPIVNPGKEDLLNSLKNLKNAKAELNKLYHLEFIDKLRTQSINNPNRYKSKSHVLLDPGDLVLIRQPLIKPYFHPMGIVSSVETNGLGEVVAAVIKKGNGESVRRHATDLVLLEKRYAVPKLSEESIAVRAKSKRKAARECSQKIRNLGDSNLI